MSSSFFVCVAVGPVVSWKLYNLRQRMKGVVPCAVDGQRFCRSLCNMHACLKDRRGARKGVDDSVPQDIGGIFECRSKCHSTMPRLATPAVHTASRQGQVR